MNIGFIGTGAIAQAVIQGLCTCAHTPQAIWVSPRNPQRAQQLVATYTPVTLANSNQAVVDHCDWVFITVKPDIAEAVLAELRFSPGQKVVNCVSTLSLAQAQALIGMPVALFKAIPLTPVALHLGPIAFTPPDPQLRSLFAPLGTAVAAPDEAALRSLAVVTAQIAPFYALQATIGRWLENQGLDPTEARGYVSSMFHALATLAMADQALSFETLLSEAAPPGGLNEQALSQLQEAGWLTQLEASLDSIQARLLGAGSG
ncbi:NAD(P)-binding domain-containing protein [Pseudomonas sp. NPDC077186]|uniref:NAD(P)-binding domain-containing protein n=1 Tax=Pseudomonas sp. NPDC077186 TaxID=3364421 RepID=UPI0037CBB23E